LHGLKKNPQLLLVKGFKSGLLDRVKFKEAEQNEILTTLYNI